MTTTSTLPAPPALFMSPAPHRIVDAEGEVLFGFDQRVGFILAAAAVDLMNIVLAKPEVMNWVIAISGTFGTDVELGYMPGSFYTKIVEAAFAGDPTSQSKLAAAFPEVVAAVQVWQNIYGSPELFAAAIKDRWILA